MSQEIQDRDYSEEFIMAHAVGSEKSGSYGDLEYKRTNEGQFTSFSLNFDGDIEINLNYENNLTRYFHLLQRLCEGKEFGEAENELYSTEVKKREKFKPLLDEDGLLIERYRQDISKFLEEEVWES